MENISLGRSRFSRRPAFLVVACSLTAMIWGYPSAGGELSANNNGERDGEPLNKTDIFCRNAAEYLAKLEGERDGEMQWLRENSGADYREVIRHRQSYTVIRVQIDAMGSDLKYKCGPVRKNKEALIKFCDYRDTPCDEGGAAERRSAPALETLGK